MATLFNKTLIGSQQATISNGISTPARALDGSGAIQALAVGSKLETLIGSGALLANNTSMVGIASFIKPLDRPVFDPVFNTPSLTLQRVEPFSAVFVNARQSLLQLRQFGLQAPAGVGTRSLIDRIQQFLLANTTDGERRANVPELLDAAANFKPSFATTLPNTNDFVTGSTVRHNEQSALFATGAALTDDLRTMEHLRTALSNLRRSKQQLLAQRQEAAADLQQRLGSEGGVLDQRERARAEALDDYAVAQRLLDEHWRQVEQRHAERARVLRSHQGLYAVKVRETPVSVTLADPLQLRAARVDDIVPGCPADPVPVAPALQPFLDTVLDIPVADWAVLDAITPLLPGREPLATLVALRQQKLQWRVAQPLAASLQRLPALAMLAQGNNDAVREVLQRPFNASALVPLQQQGRRILALEDLLASPLPALRQPAQALLGRLQAAAGCLLARLRGVAPSLRLDWGNTADADRLPVDQPGRWPGLALAEDADFNATRTLVELVAWWFAQLDADASGAARTAMRNFVRACLVLAATDDPQQMLQGRVKSLPQRFAPGALMRLQLNREPLPGAMLQLFDAQQRVIALLRVDDHDEGGSVARITAVYDSAAPLSTALQVSGLLRPA